MSYSTPTSKSTGNTVSATEWNVIVDDILACAVANVSAKGDIIAATAANAIDNVAVGANGTYLEAASGEATGIKWQTPQYCLLHKAANQSISSGSDTAITFGTGEGPSSGSPELIDPSNLHNLSSNTSRITIAVAGKYHIGGEATFAASTAGSQRYIRLYVNGSSVARQSFPAAPENETVTLNASMLYALGASDFVEVKVYQDTGGAINCTDAKLYVSLQGTY